MVFIVVSRNPETGKLLILSERGGGFKEFASRAFATETAQKHDLCKAWGYVVLEVEL